MILLAVDPGVNTGCCLLEDGRPLQAWTLRDVTPLTVVSQIAQGMLTLPDEVVIEVPDAWTRRGVNVQSLLLLQGIAFALVGWFQGQGVGVECVPVSRWKGRKAKEETALEVEAEWPGIARNSHERDALALGVWWGRGRRFEEKVAQAQR